jgi:uncharacterized protein YbjT (DUF2867 family)
MRIAIAGSSGFIGNRLVRSLVEHTPHSVVALSRRGKGLQHERVECRTADFFSLYSAEKALEGCDTAFYLLHSMIPSNRLTQGSFEDFDFILADNFARAARKMGVKHIIYVGGMIDEACKTLSRHLASRHEVETVLGSYGITLTTIRCSLVIGEEGSSFLILRKLVTRLPAMLLPSWCGSACQPVAIDDLVLILRRCVEVNAVQGRSIDVGVPTPLSYRDLIEMTSGIARSNHILIDIPAIPMMLSKLWIRLITGASPSLVYPLVDSLIHPMVVRPGHSAPSELIECYTPLPRAITAAMAQPLPRRTRLSSRPPRKVIEANLVQSVQRISLPEGMDAYMVAFYYFRWLSRFFTRILYVKNIGHQSCFYLLWLTPPLLVLTFAPERSTRDRQLFYITGGLLARPAERARLEFRESPDRRFVFAAIHDFCPALPWWVYRSSQALVHRFVMWSFGRFLQRAATRKPFPSDEAKHLA